MIPVLSVKDPIAARRHLAQAFGFRELASGGMAFGTAEIMVVGAEAIPGGLVAISFDHIAFNVADAQAACDDFWARGAVLDSRFTPSGPKEIAAFWDSGVRYVFFEGPEGCAMEFCAKNGAAADRAEGHSHFGWRTPDIAAATAVLTGLGATPLASHDLPAAHGVVRVRFLQRAAQVFEVFDEPPVPKGPPHLGWIGLLPR